MITSPDDPALETLVEELARLGGELDRTEAWPAEQLRLCGEAGVFGWFMARHWGGQEWSDPEITRGYLRLGAACLTTTFVITQRTGACLRIAGSDNEMAQQRLLAPLVSGEMFATVGISHLTTSRRHLGQPVLRAREVDGAFVLDGYSPWVTGAAHAQVIVIGAELADARQILVALPTDLPGVEIQPPPRLVGISASHTGEVRLNNVRVEREWLLAGPVENVMRQGVGAGTGGLQTSTLAIGLASAAIDYLDREALKRSDLAKPTGELRREHEALMSTLLALAGGEAVCSNDELRTAPTAWCCAPRSRPWSPPKAPATWSGIRPGGGAARRCSFWCGAARRASWRPTSASWQGWSRWHAARRPPAPQGLPASGAGRVSAVVVGETPLGALGRVRLRSPFPRQLPKVPV